MCCNESSRDAIGCRLRICQHVVILAVAAAVALGDSSTLSAAPGHTISGKRRRGREVEGSKEWARRTHQARMLCPLQESAIGQQHHCERESFLAATTAYLSASFARKNIIPVSWALRVFVHDVRHVSDLAPRWTLSAVARSRCSWKRNFGGRSVRCAEEEEKQEQS